MGKDIPSPWRPEQELVNLAVLGKLLEELGELTSITSRSIIQGINDYDPDTGIKNRVTFEEEIADVMASCQVSINHYRLNDYAISSRMYNKISYLVKWHEMIRRGYV